VFADAGMTTNGQDERSGRETRLLVLVIIVAVAALFVLARLRFPASDLGTVAPAPGPLERLAARATFDDLSGAIVGLVERLGPSIVIVRVEASVAPVPAAPTRGTSPTPVAPPAPPAATLMPAVRIAPDLAIVHVPAGMHVSAVLPPAATAEVVATDAARELALLRVAAVGSSDGTPPPFEDFGGFTYVAVVEAATGGLTARPVFVGRVDAAGDDRWTSPPLVVGGTPVVPAGALVFALDGRFIGLAELRDTVLTIVPYVALAAAAVDLSGRGGGAP
jgi:hypothetical protein